MPHRASPASRPRNIAGLLRANRRCRPGRSALLLLPLLSFLLAGCISPDVREQHTLGQMRRSPPERITVVCDTNQLLFRFATEGGTIYATAEWDPNDLRLVDYRHCLTVLTVDKKERGHFRQLLHRQGQVAVLPPAEWNRLRAQVIRDLLPEADDEGVLLAVHNHEQVLYHGSDGLPRLVDLTLRPPEISITGRVDDPAFVDHVVAHLEKRLQDAKPAANRLLFATGQDPAFILLDRRAARVVYICLSPPAELADTTPSGFHMRALSALVFRSTVLAAVKNTVTFVHRGLATLRMTIGTAVPAINGPGYEPVPPVKAGPEMDLLAWERELDKIASAKSYPGTLRFLIDGQEFFPRFIEAIQEANRSIDLRVYIFDNDDYAVKIANLLRRRSYAVKVRVMMDEIGSLYASANPPHSPMPLDFVPPNSIAAYLGTDSHVRVRQTTNPWMTADHTKTMIFDGRRAFIGGMNIGREYRYDWHDMMVELTGPIVGRIQKDFKKAWGHAGWLGDCAYAGVALFTPEKSPTSAPGERVIDLRPLYTRTSSYEIQRAQLAAARRAGRRIYLQNPYFTDDSLLNELILARRRGVDVRVILPGRNDADIMNTSSQVTANRMLEHGIRVYLYPGMSHIKAALYDGWACLGSANYDKLSLRINQEFNLGFSDPATVQTLRERLFEADFACSSELLKPTQLHWTDYLVERLADQL